MVRLDAHQAAALAAQAVDITRAGAFLSPSGTRVDIADAIAESVAGTREHAPSETLGPFVARFAATEIAVTGETTLAAARRLVADSHRTVALNFASGKHPGGGFLAGALAQEESLCRSSSLHACLERQPMYGFHAMRNDPLYSDRVIYSPDVPVFRDDRGELLETPYRLSFLTCPAPNARLALERDAAAGPAIDQALRGRALRVLEVAAAHGHDSLVLGAWGTGVFGNAPERVADAFASPLEGPMRGVFARVVFAILGDATHEARTLFEQRFSQAIAEGAALTSG